MLAIFCSPARYTQGKNATSSLGQEMATLGMEGPALIVAGRSARSLLSEKWRTSLGEVGITYHVHNFGGECSASEIERVKGAVRETTARVIIGAGGGKVLDTARAAAADFNLPVGHCPPSACS